MKKIDKEILRLAVPSIVSNVTVPLLGLCDVTMMGHVGGAREIGAIAVGSMIFNVMYWLFGFLRMGTSGLTAQAYGRQRWDESALILRRGLLIGLGFGLFFVLCQWPLCRLSLWLMQASTGIRPLVTTYFNICVWGAPAMLGLYALTGWFIGMQNTRVPMVIAIGQNVVNIVVSLTLVVVFRMGIVGVACGTLVAQWMGFLAALGWSVKGISRMVDGGGWMEDRTRGYGGTEVRGCEDSTGCEESSRREKGGVWNYFRINLDIFLRTVCLVAVNLYFTSAGSAQGELILAANTLLMQFFTFFSYVMDGFAFAGEALAGRYYGAGDRPMLRTTVGRLFRWGGVVMVLFTVVYLLGGHTVLTLLTSDASVVAVADGYLPWAVLIPVAGMAAFVWDGVFIGLTASRGMLLSCFIASLLFFAVYFLLFPVMGNHALWLALLLYLAMRGLVQTGMMWSDK